jgi:hypothetical protein
MPIKYIISEPFLVDGVHGWLYSTQLGRNDGHSAAHEFGHLLGLGHPGEYLTEQERKERGVKGGINDPSYYNADRYSLMGGGIQLRTMYFWRWAAALDDQFPSKGPYEPEGR